MAKISKAMFKKALERSLGTQRSLSRILEVSDSAISQYMDRNPDMRALFEKKRLDNVDRAEDEIFHQLEFESFEDPIPAARIRQSASQFILKTLGKHKGWIEKQEIDHSSTQGITINLVEKSVEEIKDGKIKPDNKG